MNKESKVEFLKGDMTELAEVDRICKEITSKEKRVNLLVQSQGNLNLRGRDGTSPSALSCISSLTSHGIESSEDLPRKFALNYYSRMRFISNLLPLLRNAASTPPHFSRTLSILGAGHEGRIDLEDLELKNTFSGSNCATQSTVMNDLMAEEFASREAGTTFIHSFPGIVKTPIARELPLWARVSVKAFSQLITPFTVSAEETGARQLFIATSGMYPPAKVQDGPLAAGVPMPKGVEVAKAGSGKAGGYIVNWNCDITGKENILKEYRNQGVSKTIYEHTIGIFERVEKINRERAVKSTD